uniref:DUF262 domain-containing protein n=1 Tax=Chromobacterium sp. ASV23 TaxID=2795110 RepID=UPI0018EBCD05
MSRKDRHQTAPTEELGADGRPVGVEVEASLPSNEPFDPASISIEPKVIAMDTLLRRLRQGSIRLAPSFQRKFVWDIERRSQLIESLMLRIPLPMFYVAANEDGSWDVVDGLQRLTTIRDFLLGEETNDKGERTCPSASYFALADLEFWGERFNKKTFKQICEDSKQARIVNNIMETEMRFTVINPGTPEEVKRNIFKRINTGGMPLTSQEIRHALYQGHASNLLQELVSQPAFTQAVDDSIDDSRMAARELALRFLAFYLLGAENYSGDMDRFLSNTMRVINQVPNISTAQLERIFYPHQHPTIPAVSLDEIKATFERSMNRCRQFFGSYAFRKAVPKDRRTPVNKALFDSWSTIMAGMSDKNFQSLLKCKAEF